MRRDQTAQKGFTLVEMLIVVAIIAVLAAIAIPAYSNTLEKTREATCMANRRSWCGVLWAESMLEEDAFQPGATGTAPGKNDEYKQYVCPSGGKLSYEVDENGGFIIYCSVHQEVLYNAGSTLNTTLSGLLNSDLSGFTEGNRIDSNAPSSAAGLAGWAGVVKDNLPDGFRDNAPTWAVLNDKTVGKQFIWSTVSIEASEAVGTKVPVLCYDAKTDTYSVGTSTVGATSKGYNTIATGKTYSPEKPDATNTKLSYEKAVAEYKALLKQYQNGELK